MSSGPLSQRNPQSGTGTVGLSRYLRPTGWAHNPTSVVVRLSTRAQNQGFALGKALLSFGRAPYLPTIAPETGRDGLGRAGTSWEQTPS